MDNCSKGSVQGKDKADDEVDWHKFTVSNIKRTGFKDGFNIFDDDVDLVGTAIHPISIADDDSLLIITEEKPGMKCPYTQAVMKEPVQNKICGHNYEKSAIKEFIAKKKGTARCPYVACCNENILDIKDLEDNAKLKKIIDDDTQKQLRCAKELNEDLDASIFMYD